MKTCTTCNMEKCLEDFGKEAKGKFGVKSCCKVCSSEKRKEQYAKNKDKELAYNKEYRKNNKDKELARSKRYRILNPEKVKESQIKFRGSNPEKVAEWNKIWRQSNKDKINLYTKNNRDTRREFLDIIKLEFGCNICGYNEHPRALQFDHIEPKYKKFTISSNPTVSMDKLLEELSKCRVLCANCHSIHSWNEQHWRPKAKTLDTCIKLDPRVEITIKDAN